MVDRSYSETIKGNFLMHWNGVAEARKPIIAAVNGYAVNNLENLMSKINIFKIA